MYYLEWENRFINRTSMWFFINYHYSVSLDRFLISLRNELFGIATEPMP